MLLLDTGARRAEMVGIKLADVDLELDILLVLGKGRRERTLPFGRRAGQALDRYLRARARHRYANLSWLWLGQNGRLTDTGLRTMRRRGSQVGLPGLHPHQLRHTLAHEWPGRSRTWRPATALTPASRTGSGAPNPRPGTAASRQYAINAAWVELASTAADLITWTQTTLLDDPAHVEPKTLRYRLLHVAARITPGQRRLSVRIDKTWP